MSSKITHLTPIHYRNGYIEIVRNLDARQIEDILEDFGPYEVLTRDVENWGVNNTIIRDEYGGHFLARIEEDTP